MTTKKPQQMGTEAQVAYTGKKVKTVAVTGILDYVQTGSDHDIW